MIALIRKPYGWAKLYAALLSAAFAFCLLDAFVLPRSYSVAEPPGQGDTSIPGAGSPADTAHESSPEETTLPDTEKEPAEEDAADGDPLPTEPVITATSYTDENMQITLETAQAHDTTFYVADVQISDPAYLRTALAQNTYGRNIKETTSKMAAANSAVLAVNGDYYGFRDEGYVLRNGTLYRSGSSGDSLIIDYSGDFTVMGQGDIAQEVTDSAWQILSFGPALVENGTVAVDAASEVSRSKSSNPRTAIGQISQGHYLVIVSDGRTGASEGLSLLQLAEEFTARGAVTAYNLDGGGSSTMVFNGAVVNTPTSGRSKGEREVSDIVYFGYE